MRNWAGTGLLVVAALAFARCGGEAAPETDGSAEAVEARSGEGIRVAGTPPGGLESWLADITSGMPADGSELVSSWQALHRRLLELYVGRQEYVEMYWGPNGRLQGEGGLALGQAVLDLETAYHEVLQGVVSVPLDTTAVLESAGKVKREAAAVLEAARVSGLPLAPPADSTPVAR